MKALRFALVALAASVLASSAQADTFTFQFGTAANTFAGAGTLTATLESAGTATAPAEYLVTDVSGTTRTTRNGKDRQIAGILAPNTLEGNDNLLFFDGTDYSFDPFGLSYSLRNGAQINLFSVFGLDGEILLRVNGREVAEFAPITIAVAPTPEPGSFVLLGTGLVGMLGVARRRFLTI